MAEERSTSRWHRSRLGGVGLLLRHREPVRGPSMVVAILVLAVAALLAATPSVFAAMTAQELNQTIIGAPPSSRYLISRPTGQWATAPSRDPGTSGMPVGVDGQYGAFHDQMVALRDGLPEPLRSLVGPPGFSISNDPSPVHTGILSTTPAGANVLFMVRMDPHLDRQASIVAGVWPRPAAAFSEPVGVTVSEKTASALGWRIGQQVLVVGNPGSSPRMVVLTGIFRPTDPGGDYWALHPTVVQPNVFDDGNKTPLITASVYADPESFAAFTVTPTSQHILIWYPLDLASVSGSQGAEILAQLRGAVAKPHRVPTDLPDGVQHGTIQTLTVTADIIPALAAGLGRISTARSVLTIAAIGPLAAAIAVLVLAVRALERRRRPLVGLLATRGAAPERLRLMLAADGLLTGVLPAALAVAAIWWWFGSDVSPAGLVLAGLAGLLPAAMLSAIPIAASMRRARADSGIRSRSRFRWVAEMAVLALAGVSLYLLLSVGLDTGTGANGAAGSGTGTPATSTTGTGIGTGTDLLVAATPLLLAAAACVVVLRIYPLPLQLLTRMFRRHRAAVGFLGSARALRDPVVGIAPVLAVVAGVSVAVFSVVTLSTVTHGTEQAALTQLGAPMRAGGVDITDAEYAAVQQIPGVQAAARIMLVGSIPTQVGDDPVKRSVDLYLADTAALARVQQKVPQAPQIPAGLMTGPLPGVIASQGLAEPGTSLRMGTVTVRVKGTATELPGLGRSTKFVLTDSAVTGFGVFHPVALLLSTTPGADTAAVATAVQQALGPNATVQTPGQIAAVLGADAIASGMRAALLGALGAAGIAAVAALLLTMVLTTTARARLLAILRILGLSVRQRRWLVVWEQAPAAVMALVVGGGLGVGLAALVHSAVDLTPFTGGRAQPEWHADAGGLALLLGGFVLLVAAATWAGLLMTRRVTAATAVKLDEE